MRQRNNVNPSTSSKVNSYNDVVIGSVVMVIIQCIFEVCGKLNGSPSFFSSCYGRFLFLNTQWKNIQMTAHLLAYGNYKHK